MASAAAPTEERVDRTKEALARLEMGISQLTSSDRWREYLKMQSLFHRYSFNNVLLIHFQRPDATRCAGFQTWRRLGRHVVRGEKAIWILAPVTKKTRVTDDDTDEEQVVNRLVGFTAVTTYDVSQTDGKPLPEVASRLQGAADQEVFNQMIVFGQTLGFGTQVVPQARIGAANGVTNFIDKSIRLSDELSERQRLKTMAHELGHILLGHDAPDRHRREKELEAESTAFVVLNHLCLDAGDCSFGYVAHWAGGGDEAIRGLRASGSRIQRVAREIIAALDGERPVTADGEGLLHARDEMREHARDQDRVRSHTAALVRAT